MALVTTRVVGMAELRRGLQQMHPALDKQLAVQLLKVASAIVPIAQAMMPRISGWAAGTLKPKVTLRGAQITAGTGSPAEDYVPWLIFGGSTGRGHRQSTSGKGIGGGAIYREWMGKPGGMGRYIWPAIQQKRGDTLEAIDKAIAEAARAGGFETSGHI